MKKYTFLLTLIALFSSCNQSGVSKSSEFNTSIEDKVVGTFTTGGVTQTFRLDNTVETESPYGTHTYNWKVIEENPQFIKIEEIQGNSKVIFYLYENSTKYPNKISNCIKNFRSSVMKNYTAEILISEYALESSDGCDGLYFKGNIE